jgi:hypothetical protein
MSTETEDGLFQQVELRRGKKIAVAWIPARAAQVGNEFALRDDDDIWRVVEVTPFVLNQEQLHRLRASPKETMQ